VLKITIGTRQQLFCLALGQHVAQCQPGNHRVRGQHFPQQAVVQRPVVNDAGIAARIFYFRHQVMSRRQFYGALEMHAPLFRFAAQRRRQQRGEHAQVQVGLAVAISLVQFDDPRHHGFDLGQAGDRIPVAAVGLYPAGPGRAAGIQHRHIVHFQGRNRGGKIVIGPLQQIAQPRVMGAKRTIAVIARLARKPFDTLRLPDKSRRISAIQLAASQQQIFILRIALDQAVHEQQVGGRTGFHRLRVVLVEDRAGQIAGKPAGGGSGDGVRSHHGARQQPLALAGIMGGLASAVSDSTRHLFLESAWFRPETISTLSRAMVLQTESSLRFERGVDPALQRPAIERATELLLGIMGGKPGPVIEQSVRRFLPRVNSITLRMARAERILGTKVLPRDIESILRRLGMKLKKSGSSWTVTPPSYRFDVALEVDLIEEIARIHGYDKLPSSRPRIEMTTKPVPESGIAEARWRTVLIDRDYQEVITYSFIDPGNQALIDPRVKPLTLTNPISVDMAVMRTTLWPGLLQAIRYNLNRQQTRVRIFEIGRTFIPMGSSVVQNKMLGGAVCGGAQSKQWGIPDRAVDFFDVKSDIEAVLGLTARSEGFAFNAGHHPALHPGQSAEIWHQGRKLGMLGVLHPDIQSQLELELSVVVFELDLSLLLRPGNTLIFKEFSRFPSIRRDIAVIVAEKIPAQAVIDCVRKVAGNLLVNLELFDEYRGKGIDSGRKSLAVGLTFQDSSRTLNEDEAERMKAEVIAALGAELGAQPRQ